MSVVDPPPDSALTSGLVQAWITDAMDALGRLMTAGLSYPDPELPETFSLLAERAEALGSTSGQEGLSALAQKTSALRPGPSDLASRTALARELWSQAMRTTAWLRVFRDDIALQSAVVRARGEQVGSTEREDVPRYTDRMVLDGMSVTGTRLTLIGHDDHGQQVVAFDPLGAFDNDDPFGSPVISRLFQDQMWLSDLADTVLDFERHPMARRGNTVLLQPAFRSVPRRRARETGERRDLGSVVRLSIEDGEPVVRTRDGASVFVDDTLGFNVWKKLASLGMPTVDVPVRLHARSRLPQILSCDEDGRMGFPAVDARCWRVHPGTLATAGRQEAGVDGLDALWLRAAVALFGGVDGPGREDLLRALAESRPGLTHGVRLTWFAARMGVREPVVDLPKTPPDDATERFAWVWLRLYAGATWGELQSTFDEWYAVLPEPAPVDVAARVLLLDARGLDEDPEDPVKREPGRDYLQAHLQPLRRTGRDAPVLPGSFGLLWWGDVHAWVHERGRSGQPFDGLEVPVRRLRTRVARQLYRWRVEGVVETGPGGLADSLALAATAKWGRTLVG